VHVEVVLRCLGGVNITTPATRTDSSGSGRGGHFVGDWTVLTTPW